MCRFTTESEWYISPVRGEGGVLWVLLMRLKQQLHCRLWDENQPGRALGLGPGQLQGAVLVADVLPAHRNRPVLYVHIIPPQGYQQAAG